MNTNTPESTELKRTPLHAAHLRAGARMVPFGGWDMPVQYAGVRAEHTAVREGAGMFDVSHMGEFRVTGPDAEAFLQQVTTNDVSKLRAGRAQYNWLPGEYGRPGGRYLHLPGGRRGVFDGGQRFQHPKGLGAPACPAR